MSTLLARSRAALAASVLLALTDTPAAAGDGFSQSGATSPSYVGYGGDENRRPFDGSYRVEPMYAGAAYNWGGLYIGGDLGGGWSTVTTSGSVDHDLDTTSFLGGIHAGYGFQMGSVVAGLEVDGTWADLSGKDTVSGGPTLKSSTDWLSSARFRAGYATGSWLFYGTAGLALGDFDLKLQGKGVDKTLSDTMVGYVVGGGAEMALTESVSARVEALYYGFGAESYTVGGKKLDADMDATVLRGGLSIKLN